MSLEVDKESQVAAEGASRQPPLVISSYDAMRRELQRLASEKKKIRDDLRDLSFKARALDQSPGPRSSTSLPTDTTAAATSHTSSTLAIAEDDAARSTSRAKRSRSDTDDTDTARNDNDNNNGPGADSDKTRVNAASDSGAPPAKRAKVDSNSNNTPSLEDGKHGTGDSQSVDAAASEPTGAAHTAAQSQPVAPPIKVQKDRRMFQNIMGTLQGLKRQMQHGKVAETLAQRHALEVQADERNQQNSAKQAEEFRAKFETDRAALQQRDTAVYNELIEKEELLYSWIVQQYDSELEPWLLTPPDIGVVVAWRPGKKDSTIDALFQQNTSSRTKTTVSRPAAEPKVDRAADEEPSSASSAEEDHSDHPIDESDAAL
eukprot:TRINITY_DN13469_c0_g1_i1.p1 TRINITY_DN13469_c0_g1~~TRINITY_DN13469_c0_g1_i1.p1  ORF type:complete len:374 (+),score=78.91 TRINITY_DN13469_c0_g1_i1:24-1145(+)